MPPTTWIMITSRLKMKKFYSGVLPKITRAARKCGYAIAVHGSMRRDLDLIAVPWVEKYSDKDTLAKKIQLAACGFKMARYDWEQKPNGRVATAFPICWASWNEPSVGHVDLSIMGDHT